MPNDLYQPTQRSFYSRPGNERPSAPPALGDDPAATKVAAIGHIQTARPTLSAHTSLRHRIATPQR
jgi:hypothetical protein